MCNIRALITLRCWRRHTTPRHRIAGRSTCFCVEYREREREPAFLGQGVAMCVCVCVLVCSWWTPQTARRRPSPDDYIKICLHCQCVSVCMHTTAPQTTTERDQRTRTTCFRRVDAVASLRCYRISCTLTHSHRSSYALVCGCVVAQYRHQSRDLERAVRSSLARYSFTLCDVHASVVGVWGGALFASGLLRLVARIF